MVEIRDQTKITSLENAWKNCGVLNTASTGDIKCLPISDVRNVQNINYAFAVDEIFKGKKSYIDNVATMETVDPEIVTKALGTFEYNQFKGTSTGASGEENKTNLKTMFANNLDLTVDGETSDNLNGEDIFDKLYNAVNPDDIKNLETPGFVTHTHVRYFPYLDGHTTCFSKNQGTTTIGTGKVAVVKTSAITNEFYFDKPEATETTTGFLQTEVAFKVGDETILSKTINESDSDQTAFGDTQIVSVDADSGGLKGDADNSVTTGAFQLGWDGTACTKKEITLSQNGKKPLEIPNNMKFKVCNKVTVKKETTFNVEPGANIQIESGGSIVVGRGAVVNVKGTINILAGGKIDNKGGTINILKGGKIENGGTITNEYDETDGVFVGGKIENYGTITNEYDGTINNESGSTFTNTGRIENYGTITNKDLGSTITNNGIITNKDGGTITNKDYGTIANKDGGTIENRGTIHNEYDGTITNTGTITNHGRIDNGSGIIYTRADGINGFPVEGNEPIIIES